jgi:aminopeptidase-like protein
MCHPAQFNDGLVGVLVNVYLAKWLNKYSENRTYTYKFLFMPETIGSHAYCSNKDNFKNSVMAVFTEMLALDAPLHIQMSESEDDLVNVYLRLAAKSSAYMARFSPYLGVIRNDEKVFGAPGIEVPSASVTRALGREYSDHPYTSYHTSEDNVENSNIEGLKEALSYLQVFISIMEEDRLVERQFDGIPMLSRHDLFFNPQTHRNMYDLQEKMVWQLKRPKAISRIAEDLDADFFDILDLLSRWEAKKLVKFTHIRKEV